MEVAAPGLEKDMVKMNIDKDGYLNVSIENKDEKKEEKEEHYLRREFSYSSYSQSYALPEDADQEKISAEVSDGVLKIAIPKIAKEEKKDDVKHLSLIHISLQQSTHAVMVSGICTLPVVDFIWS